MIVFNEGIPGAGKSYDAVVTHILPALKAGRPVYARLNGLNHAAIAAYLKLHLEDINDLLHVVGEAEVPLLPTLVQNDSLIVIDEAHQFYVASRQPLSDETEQFFAEHRHRGLDIVLISQWYKRLHTAVRARVERKAVFTKLNVLGMKNRYIVRYFDTVTPDKFEKTGSQTKTYDKRIFPLYQSVQVGTENLQVYTAGSRTVWQRLTGPALLFIPAAILGAFFVIKFFSGDVSFTKAHANTPKPGGLVATPQASTTAKPVSPVPTLTTVPKPVYPPNIQYVLDINSKARARLAGYIQRPDGTDAGLIEWCGEREHAFDALTFDDLRTLGWKVTVTGHVATLTWQKQTLIATSWPRESYYGVPQSQLDWQQAHRLPAAELASPPVTGGLAASKATPRIGPVYQPPDARLTR